MYITGIGEKKFKTVKPSMIYPTYQIDKEIESECKEDQDCKKEKFCMKERNHCVLEFRKQNRPSREISKYCSLKFAQCNQRHILRLNARKILNKLDSGSAVTFNIMGALKGEHDLIQREVKSYFTIGYEPAHHKAGEKIETDAKISIKTSPDTTPYKVEIEASTKIHKPISKWDIQAILMQNLQTDTSIHALFDN